MSGTIALPSHRRIQERRDQRTQVKTEALVRFANDLMDRIGANRSQSWVSRQVRNYVKSGRGLFGPYLLKRLQISDERRERDPELAYLLAYADPTGETAVRNVMREQRR